MSRENAIRMLSVCLLASALTATEVRADLTSIPGFTGGVFVNKDPIPPNTLWFNGNPDGVTSYYNQNDAVFSQVLYNDFNVTDSKWLIQSVWSNNIFYNGPPSSTNATWEIWSGLGSTPTLVASGDSAAGLTPTGFIVNGLTEYMVQVSGLSVTLSQGTYWLAVYPDNSNSGPVGNDSTSGAGAVGSPPGNNGNLYFNTGSPPFYGTFSVDTSAGVAGQALTATPEPSTLAIASVGALGLVAFGVRRRARS
jgi:hypothetical protein